MKRARSNPLELDELPEIEEIPPGATAAARSHKRSCGSGTDVGKKDLKEEIDFIFTKFGNAHKGGHLAQGEFAETPTLAIQIENFEKEISFPLCEKTGKDIINALREKFVAVNEEIVSDSDSETHKGLEFDPEAFKILNPYWTRYFKNVLLRVFKNNLDIEVDFDAKLYKLLIHDDGAESFIDERVTDFDKAQGIFGTLIIQLPSIYTEGGFDIYHEKRNRQTMDFSSSRSIEKGFKTYSVAFFRNCQYELLPVEEGVRVCLVYDLVVENKGEVPSMLPQPTQSYTEKFTLLINQWKSTSDPKKLVYALSQPYIGKRICADKLNQRDKAIVFMVRKLSVELGISCFLVTLNKVTKTRVSLLSCNFEQPEEEEGRALDTKTYLEHLTQLHNMMDGDGNIDIQQIKSQIVVDPKKELVNKPKMKMSTVSLNPKIAGYGSTSFLHEKICHYKVSALVIFPTNNAVDVLLSEKVPYEELENIFKQQYFHSQNFSTETILEVAKKLAKYGSDSLFKAVLEMNDLDLTKLYLTNYKLCNLKAVANIVRAGEVFGWKSFGEQLYTIFENECINIPVGICKEKFKLEVIEALVGQTQLVDEDRREICGRLFRIVLDKLKEIAKNDATLALRDPGFGYLPYQKKRDYLSVVFQVGRKLDFDIFDYACAHPLKTLVPVLVGEFQAKVQNGLADYASLTNIGRHIISLMAGIVANPVARVSLVRDDYEKCGCGDCTVVDCFMKSEEPVLRFAISKPRRQHIHRKLEYLKNITHETERMGSPQTLVIKKLKCVNKEAEFQAYEFCVSQLPLLKAAFESACVTKVEAS